MKNPSIAKMVKMAGNSRTMAKMKHEAAAKMKKEAAMKMKMEAAAKMKKDDSMAKMKEPMKMKEEGAMKMKKPMKMKEEESMAKMKKPMKMKKDDSMAKKALVGKQKNLPPELKAAIEAAPGKMKKGESMAKQGYRPTYDSKGEKIDYTDPDVLKREKEANKRIYKNRTKAKEEKGLSKFDKKEIKRLKEKSTIPPGKLKKK